MASETSSSHTHTVLNSPDSPHSILHINLSNITKLNSTNYITWHLQIQSLLEGYNLHHMLDAACSPPPATLSDSASTNPDYTTWVRQDRLLFSALLGSITAPLQPLVAHSMTSLAAWQTLASIYATPSRGHIKQIKAQLKRCVKGHTSITDYMHSIKSRADHLALLGKPLDSEDLIDRILDGLGEDYQSVVDAINARDSPISFSELHEKLLNREAFLLHSASSPTLSLPATAHAASFHPRQARRSSSQSARSSPSPASFSSDNRQPRPYLGRCQACGTQGHSAKRCSLYRLIPQQPPSTPPPHRAPTSSPWQPRANPAALQPSPSPTWLLDSGASHHVTADLDNLSLHSPYHGSDGVQIGDGSTLPISHTGSLSLITPSRPLHLRNVLFVPNISQNLLSVSQFCSTNRVSVEFSPLHFQVKDLHSGKLLMTGRQRHGVYEMPSPITSRTTSPLLAFSSIKTSPVDWHSRLGHPSLPILKTIISASQLPLAGSFSSFSHCHACACSKSHKLPFSTSSLSSSRPLELIFSDVWTSPVTSLAGHRYYVLFVDHFTRYSWLYPIFRKSDVLNIFVRFKTLVENKFNNKISSLFSDNGGEYIALADFLSTHGISHLTSPPHTPEHNGISERRHRHIVETGLALLTHSSMPLSYWHYAFTTSVYLINRLPTVTLNRSSPFQLLFNTSPNYTRLRIFGCLCYPWLRPYSRHKLSPRSSACVFLGYSGSQSAYLCFDLSSSRLYTSRHVDFVESHFPFAASPTSPSTSPPADSSSSWLPPVLSLSPSLSTSPPPPQLPPSVSSPAPTASFPGPDHSLPGLPDLHPTPLASASPSPGSSPRLPPTAAAPSPPSPPLLSNHHPMVTRAKNRIHKPLHKLSLLATTSSSSPVEPTTVTQALQSPEWRRALSAEYDALVRNNTWELVPPSPSLNPVGCKWVFRVKRRPDGSDDRFKARLVAKGFHQRPGVDYHDTFSPVVKPTTIRLVLSLAISRGWSLRQIDVDNAFLQGRLSDTVHMSQPPGFVDRDRPQFLCKLNKAIYGLKQAPRAWYMELRSFLLHLGFQNSLSDSSLFFLHSSDITVFLLVYVDDIIITSNHSDKTQHYIDLLAARFSLKDLGPLTFFLGIEVTSFPSGILLSQHRYISSLLSRTHMRDAKPVSTPMDPNCPLTLSSGTALPSANDYRTVVGSLQYLCLTRPDIAFAVNRLSQFLHRPTIVHWTAVKRLLRYLLGTIDHGLFLRRSNPLSLHAFSDADWAGNKDDYTSTGAYLVYLGGHPISWSSKKQRTVARSSTEAEYRAVAAASCELAWICSLLSELGVSLPTAPIVYCDNVGATYLCSNPVFHSRMKHIAIDFHFVRDKVQSGALRVHHVSSADQLADVLTKPLSRGPFHKFRSKIGISAGAPS